MVGGHDLAGPRARRTGSVDRVPGPSQRTEVGRRLSLVPVGERDADLDRAERHGHDDETGGEQPDRRRTPVPVHVAGSRCATALPVTVTLGRYGPSGRTVTRTTAVAR